MMIMIPSNDDIIGAIIDAAAAARCGALVEENRMLRQALAALTQPKPFDAWREAMERTYGKEKFEQTAADIYQRAFDSRNKPTKETP